MLSYLGKQIEKSTGGTRKKIPGEPVRKNTREEPIDKEERLEVTRQPTGQWTSCPPLPKWFVPHNVQRKAGMAWQLSEASDG